MKAYKFFSKPNHCVNDGETGRLLLKFNNKGEYITLDPLLSKRMMKSFEYKEIELIEKSEETKVYKCKKCDFQTKNMGELMAHYRTEHPKKEG